PGKVTFTGKIDAVAETPDSRVWLTEHKTHQRFPDEHVRFSNFQAVMYCWVLPEIGFPSPDGVLWDYIRTKPPTVPDLLVNGGLSKRKNIDTTPEVYLKAIKEHGLNPADYQDMLELLKGKEESFYKRVFLPAPKSITGQ